MYWPFEIPIGKTLDLGWGILKWGGGLNNRGKGSYSYVYVYICMYMCVYIHIHVCTEMHISKNLNPFRV